MLFDDAQSYTAFKSSCKLSISVTSPTPEYSLVSSGKLTSLDADTSSNVHGKELLHIILVPEKKNSLTNKGSH